VRTSEKRAKRLVAQADDAKQESAYLVRRINKEFQSNLAMFFFCIGCFLSVFLVIGILLQTWTWVRSGIGQIEDCVKVESIQWANNQGTYSDPFVMFKTKTGKDAKLKLGVNYVTNETLKRLTEASYIDDGCVKVWYKPGEEEKLSRSSSNFPLTELGGMGQWTLLTTISCFLLTWLFESDFSIISLGSEPGAVLFFLLLSSILSIGLIYNVLSNRDEWLEKGVGQVQDCAKIEAVEWGELTSYKGRNNRYAYGLFRTKTDKSIRLFIEEFRVRDLQEIPSHDLLSRSCMTLWYQPDNEQEARFSKIEQPFSGMSIWQWLTAWASLFFAGLSWIFFSGRSNAQKN
jgi:hypothetical protein